MEIEDAGLQKAVTAVGGTKLALAKALGLTKGAISQWDAVPLARVLDVERVTGVPRHELRPDIFVGPA